MLYFTSILYFEFHIFCNQIAIRCCFFTESVFSDRKHFDVMCFLCTGPAFHNFSILIKDREFCSRKFFSGDILFGDFHLRHIILHLNFLHIGSIFDGELHAFSCHITIGRFCFNQCVFFSDSQLTDHMCFFTGRPFIHDISISIYHFQLTSRKFFSGCQTGFCKFYNGWLILKGKIIGYSRLILTCILKSKFLYFIVGYESIRCIEFFYIVSGSYWKICNKCDLSFFIRRFQFNDLIGFDQDFTSCLRLNVFFGK